MGLRNLSNEKLIEGIKKSYANGDALLSDAFLLGESKRFPRAYTLCQLAIEEFAKVPLLFNILMDRLVDSKIDYEIHEKTFKKHEMKIELGIVSEIAMWEYYKHKTGEDYVDKLIESAKEFRNRIKESNDLKNDSLYVDIKNDNFQSPDEVIGEEQYKIIAGTASLRSVMLKFFTKLEEGYIDKLKLELNKKIDDNTN
jgi:AbiV family abortive infection protein